MRYREYEMPVEYYHISILNGHPESSCPEYDLIPGARIQLSIPERSDIFRRRVTTLEEYVDTFIENDDSYLDLCEGYEAEKRFFSEHYREIFCGKYPEWIVYDIDALCDGCGGFNIAFANTKTGCKCHCWLINNQLSGGELQIEVYDGDQLTERYLLRRGGVVEFIGQSRREYSFYTEEGPDGHERTMATIEEYGRALL